MANTINKVDSKVEHAGLVMEATASGVNEAMSNYAESGLAGSEYLKEELMPGLTEYYDSAKGM